MKNKSFLLRLVSLVVIVAALLAYNGVTASRLEAEEEAAQAVASALSNADTSTVDSGSEGDSTPTEPAGLYKDGTYEGEAQGYGGPVRVSVVVSGGNITSVAVLSHSGEDEAYYSMAEKIIPNVISSQSTAVDTASGATFSSNGILNAVDKALEGAVN
ncbi:MAG: FMN-binding protein [Clostridia bacterium]|nr:FMN-binding protein [Clostridia bacterium]MBQ8468974.1 FMN-binding protein [Clostridia bacterium]MBR1703932.1 FMN-binding protein [Clostridia bacterium]